MKKTSRSRSSTRYVVLAIVLILLLVYRPEGILGSREVRWSGKLLKLGPKDPLKKAEKSPTP